jgi:hypothetical protein
MKIRNRDLWQETIAANPLPAGLGPNPEHWPDDLTEEQLSAGYGAVVIIAAGRWMDAMEHELVVRPDATIADVADGCFHDVDRGLGRWGLTGFQYGCVVSILAEVWEHGDRLRRWHNLAIQLGDEGERANETGCVLNPALISFEPET